MSLSKALFGDLVDYEIGGGWGTETEEPLSASPAYVIRGTDIPKALRGDISKVPLRFHSASNLRSRALRSGDIIFEVSGGSKGQPVGRALLINDRLLSAFNYPVMCASFCKLIRIRSDAADPGFLFRVLQSAYADGRLDTFQVQSTGITNFKWKPFLQHFEFRLPDRRVQTFVAETVDVFDHLIENNRRRVEVLEEMARAIYREWFVHFRYPGAEQNQNNLRDRTQHLTRKRLADVAELHRTGVQPGRYPEELFDHYSLPAFDSTHMPSVDAGASIKSGKFLLSDPVILVSKLNPRIERTWFVEPSALGRSVASTEFMVFTPRPGLSLAWLYLLVRSDEFQERLRAVSGGTSTSHQRAKPADFLAMDVVRPSDRLASDFTGKVGPQLAMVQVLRQQAKRLGDLRDLLLPKLVSGEIDVSSLDLDALVEGSVA